MKVLDLFSGIGGFSLGLERAGLETIAFCEIEPFCQKILNQHWPDVPVFEDIRKLKISDLQEMPDLICGGYPCQPFSVAGKQRGQKDDRHLWPEMFRLIKECTPPLWSLLKMLLVTSEWGSTRCYLTWKAQVTPHNRLLFRLVPSMPRIKEIESGLWATPNTMDHLPPRTPKGLMKLANGHRKGRSRPSNLREQVDYQTMKMWPTPRASEYKDTGPVGSKSHQHMKDRHYLAAVVKEPEMPNGKLNPQWVEWLMGYPIGWTELNL